MNAPADSFSSVVLPLPALRRSRARRGAFALVITLLILSLLIIVAVSYLSSMVSERQTADAYTSKVRAEQIAQAGVDSATAILTESFRDFPDSATVWDIHQSTNSDGSFNEGASLYLRAMPTTVTLPAPTPGATPAMVAVADPQPPNTNGTPNDPNGNNPNNPACENFVLPLISGVPLGRAQLASNVVAATNVLPKMNLSVTDQTKQNFTDLNVRRYAGDTQGVIGSPVAPTPAPGSVSSPSPTPKPARALWVNLKTQQIDPTTHQPVEVVTGRYAFWVDDESFRANSSYLGAGTTRPDNQAQPTPTASPTSTASATVRSLQPSDMTLVGPLQQAGDADPADDAKTVFTTRGIYPGNFFPDPLAFAHGFPSPSPSPSAGTSPVELLRYLTTNQSGTLNFTRHGTQRLNLNGIFGTANTTSPELPLSNLTIQSAVDQIVQTLKFHLPNFGQRFYRTSTATDSATLNAKQVVATGGNDMATIYLYKVAANLCDYLDTDSQPTMILSGGQVASVGKPPLAPPLSDEQSNNTYWAQGKESSPLIEEVAVRYRPVVGTSAAGSPLPPRDFDMKVDYYIKVWNMTDRDIYATQQPAPNDKLPHLNGASIYIRDQQGWAGYPQGDVFVHSTSHPTGELLPSNGDAPQDWEINLSTGTPFQPSTSNPPTGVVFRAGAVTVITTDPDCFSDHNVSGYYYSYQESPTPSVPTTPNYGKVLNPANVYLCPLNSGTREYFGHVVLSGGGASSNGGLMLGGGFTSPTIYSGTEIDLVNNYGYLDIVRGAITKRGGPGSIYYANTWKYIGRAGYYNDFSFGGGLMGNVTDTAVGTTGVTQTATPSVVGDPRTNNEQVAIRIDPGAFPNANNSDGTHFMPGTRTLGAPSNVTVKPDQVASAAGATGWPDYYSMPVNNANPDATNAPVVVGDGPLTSIGQLGDVFDPARIQGTGGALYSRGGGRTFKIGQPDDRYSFDPTGNAAPNNTADFIAASNSWASWRLADVFSIDSGQEEQGRINLNGVLRDNGAALNAALSGWTFQPTTASGAPVDPTIHGDGHPPAGALSSLAQLPLVDPSSTYDGKAQLIAAIINRLHPATTTGPATPTGPFFERGEFGELLSTNNLPLFGSSPVGTSATANTALLTNKVDMNKTFDHGREEMFRRLSELICTRGDTFTVYAIGQSIVQAPVSNATTTPPLKITSTHRLRVTFRLVPKDQYGNDYAPPAFNGGNLTSNPISSQVATRFAKPDHYNAQVLETSTF